MSWREAAVPDRYSAFMRLVLGSVAYFHEFPSQALQKLHAGELTDAEKVAWMNSARLDAILGSCMRSMPSVRSGIRAYICFAGTVNAFACRSACGIARLALCIR